MLPGSFATEALAGAGFDWLLLDTEHSPADVLTVLPQLQAAAAYDVSAVVRPASNDPVLIKRLRSEEHTSELQSLMRISYAVFCLKKKKQPRTQKSQHTINQPHTHLR